ncbi:peroxisomal bioproteinsis factor 11 [Chamberlinius hualienensis]
MTAMESVVQLLSRHGGRDRIIRISSYLSFLISGVVDESNKEKLCILGSQLSSCRTVLRLFDDIVMLNYTLNYGLGKKEEDRLTRYLSVLGNMVDQLFYPVEHIAWAADKQILRFDSTGWWYLSTFLWTTSLYLNLLKSLRALLILRRKRNRLLQLNTNSVELEEIQSFIWSRRLSVLEQLADLCNAINWMPPNFLWSGKLKVWQVGFCGLISSLIGLYKMYKFA